jgi:dTDP-4-dehydrorhamnose reductase
MNRIWITGSSGQLGSEFFSLQQKYPFHFLFSDREVDLTDIQQVKGFLNSNSVEGILNCAAYTAVDKAESEQELAMKVNASGVANLVAESISRNLKLIHISTDHVFDGKGHRPYLEEDPTDPVNLYGKTKWEGEQMMIHSELRNSAIIRTSWVYSSFGANFVKTMRKLGAERDLVKVISDQIGSPTYARDLAEVILEILPNLSNDQTEYYHYSNEGACSWYDFALAIMEMSGLKCQVLPIATEEYPTPAARPSYSLMNKAKIRKQLKAPIPHWRSSLQDCIKLLESTK